MISDEMFENLISPAYFSSRLERPLGIIKSFFKDPISWGSTVEGNERMEEFGNSEIFSEIYFRGMMGTFMSNVLHVRIETAVIGKGEEKYQEEQEEKGRGEVEEEEEEKEEVGDEKRKEKIEKINKSNEEKKNFGVGLFHLYSKLNHSCCCNTVNQGGSVAEVSLIATKNIAEGERKCSNFCFMMDAVHT